MPGWEDFLTEDEIWSVIIYLYDHSGFQPRRWEAAGAEGERLDRLRQRFWDGAAIGRLDRVLVVEAQSLLWALDPLEAASEGEVLLTTPSAAVLERLQAQLQLLDQLRRPQLLADGHRQALVRSTAARRRVVGFGKGEEPRVRLESRRSGGVTVGRFVFNGHRIGSSGLPVEDNPGNPREPAAGAVGHRPAHAGEDRAGAGERNEGQREGHEKDTDSSANTFC